MAPPSLPGPYVQAFQVVDADGGMPVHDVENYVELSLTVLGLPGQSVVVRTGDVPPAYVEAAIARSPFYQVFLRLPASELTRCRAVHMTFLYVIDSTFFRLDHYRHQFRQPMPLCFYSPNTQNPDGLHINLHAVDLRARASTPLIQLSVAEPREFRIEGSCDGILLVSYGDRLCAFNPCTRHWVRVPPIHVDHDIIGFFVFPQHQYTVLYRTRADESEITYWIFTLAEPMPQLPGICIGRPHPPTSPALERVLTHGIVASHILPPVLIISPAGQPGQSILYWLPRAVPNNSCILTFNAVTESFDWIPPPRVQEEDGADLPLDGAQLLDIGGMLAMACISPTKVDVWVLEDNVGFVWAHWYEIVLQVAGIDLCQGYDDGGATRGTLLLYSWEPQDSELAECPTHLLQSSNGTVVCRHALDGYTPVLSRYTIQENLLRYDFLWMRVNDVDDEDPPFLRYQ